MVTAMEMQAFFRLVGRRPLTPDELGAILVTLEPGKPVREMTEAMRLVAHNAPDTGPAESIVLTESPSNPAGAFESGATNERDLQRGYRRGYDFRGTDNR